MYAAQLHSREPFGVLRKTVTINILSFVLYPGSPKLHWKSVMRDEETGTPVGRVQELHFIEVPKFRAIGHQPCTPLEGWLAFLANQEGETMESIANRDPAVRKALEIVEFLKEDDAERLLYLRREMAIHDEISIRFGAHREGKAEGLVEAALMVARTRLPGLTAADEDGLRAAATRDAQAALKVASACETLEALREWLRTL